MEKLKNILHPGAKYDEEALYGSGKSEDPVMSGSSNTTSGVGGSALSDTTNQRPGLDSDAGSTTAIRHGVPGVSSGSGLAGSSNTSGLTGNSYPDRSVGSGTTGKPSTTEEIREIASGRGEHGPQENLGSSLTEREFPVGGNSSTATSTNDPTTGSSYQSNLGRDSAPGGAPAGSTGLVEQGRPHEMGDTTGTTSGAGSGLVGGPEDWQHSHTGHAHEFEGDPCEHGAQPAGGPHFVPGPHITDTANRLDPHVGTTGQGDQHSARDTTLAGGPAYEADNSRGATSSSIDPLATSSQNPSTMSGTGLGSSSGHHAARDTALVGGLGAGAYEAEPSRGASSSGIDPLNSSLRDPATTSGTGLGSLTEHEVGRDNAFGGGLGSAAAEDDRRHGSTVSGAGRHGSTALDMNRGMDPGASETHHQSGILNTLDPRVAQDTTSTAAYAATENPAAYDSQGREARVADASGMQGHRFVVPYEPDAPPLYKHDGGAYTDEEKYGKKGAAERKATAAGLTPADTTATEEERKPSIFSRLDPRKKNNTSETNDVEGVEDPAVTGQSGQTYQAADAGGMQGGRVVVPHESNTAPLYKHDGGAYTDKEKYGAAAAGAGAVGAAGYEAEKHHHDKQQISAGAGEFSKKDAEKEAKHKQKEMAKEDKQHEKELIKQEKHHEKVLAEEEKHHEKEVTHEEKHDEKKHGGFLSKLLHRDKHDKEPKEDEVEKKASGHHSHTGAHSAEVGAVGAAGAGVVGYEEHEKHERNRLHKDPPASISGNNSKYADAPTSGYASQVTGGTGTTALAQGDSVPAGSHATGLGNTLDPAVASRGENIEPSGTSSAQGTSSVAGHPGDYSGPVDDPIMERVKNFPAMGHLEDSGRKNDPLTTSHPESTSQGTGQYGSSAANPGGSHALSESANTANTTATSGTGQYGSSSTGAY